MPNLHWNFLIKAEPLRFVYLGDYKSELSTCSFKGEEINFSCVYSPRHEA
jgi:hypothetical protein